MGGGCFNVFCICYVIDGYNLRKFGLGVELGTSGLIPTPRQNPKYDTGWGHCYERGKIGYIIEFILFIYVHNDLSFQTKNDSECSSLKLMFWYI